MFSLLYLKRGGNAKKLFRFIRVRAYNMHLGKGFADIVFLPLPHTDKYGKENDDYV